MIDEPSEYRLLPLRRRTLDARRLAHRVGITLWLWSTSLLMLIGVVVSGAVQWVWITVGSVTAAHGVYVSILHIRRGPLLLGTVVAIVAALLVFLDWIVGQRLDWFLPVGLPILTALAGLLASGGIAFRVLPATLGVAATIALAGCATLAVDAAVSAFHTGAARLTWSVIVVLATFPSAVAVALLYRLVLRHVDLRRHFHV